LALNYVTITGTFDDGTGSPLSGSATFTPSTTVYAAGVPVAIEGSPVTAQIANGILLAGGGGALKLLATDNTGLTFESLTGFFYWTVSLSFGTGQTWSFFLPSSPSTVDLYSLAHTTAGGGGFTSPMTTLGDMIFENATPAAARLPGNTTAAKNFLTQTGTGSVSAVPAWGTIAAADVPGVDGVTVTGTPTSGQIPTATSGTAATWQSPASVDQPYVFRPENYGAKGDGKMALVTVSSTSKVINTTPIGTPAAPTLSNTGSGGSLTAGTYQAEVTFVNQWGETVASASASQAISGAQPLTISSPTPTRDATGWYAYVTVAGGSTYFRQQTAGSPTPIGASLVLTANPGTSGANPPGSDTTAAQVFTSTAVDGGKNIMICGGNGAGPNLIDTIASVQSPTQATLTTNTPTANTAGCSMVFSSDDRLAIDSCVSAAEAYALAHDYFAQVVFGDKIYGLGTGLFQETVAANGIQYNTQLRIPVPNVSGETRKLEFHLVGPGDNSHCQFWVSALPNVAGGALVSYTTGPGTADPTFGQQSAIGGPTGGTNYNGSNTFANVKAVIRGLQVVTPGWCNTIGIDLSLMGGCRIDGSVYGFAPSTSTGGGVNPSNAWTGNAGFQGSIGGGIQLPNAANNADIVIVSLCTEALPSGIFCQADHVTILRLASINCYQGINVSATGINTHALTIEHWTLDGTSFALNNAHLNSGHVQCSIVMDSENAAMTDVRDGSPGAFYGTFHWSDSFRTAPTIVGAQNLKVINEILAPGYWSSPPAVPAASTNQQNTAWRDAMVVVSGGTGVAISIDGQTTGLGSGQAVYVPSGKNINLGAYTGTPTWKWWLL